MGQIGHLVVLKALVTSLWSKLPGRLSQLRALINPLESLFINVLHLFIDAYLSNRIAILREQHHVPDSRQTWISKTIAVMCMCGYCVCTNCNFSLHPHCKLISKIHTHAAIYIHMCTCISCMHSICQGNGSLWIQIFKFLINGFNWCVFT